MVCIIDRAIRSYYTFSLFLLVLFCSFLYQDLIASGEHEQKLIDHVKQSIAKAEIGESKLSADVLAVPGMTSHKVKHLLNNICSLEENSYFEIGVWKGATFTAALYGNNSSIRRAVAIDDWSEFAGPKSEFEKNCKDFIADIRYQFYSQDCFVINKKNLFDKPIDIYFYDGNHTAESQEKAFTYFDSLFAQTFIAIIDDWNFPKVPLGTQKAFKDLGYTILFERVLPANFVGDTNSWWNGLYVAVIRRP